MQETNKCILVNNEKAQKCVRCFVILKSIMSVFFCTSDFNTLNECAYELFFLGWRGEGEEIGLVK